MMRFIFYLFSCELRNQDMTNGKNLVARNQPSHKRIRGTLELQRYNQTSCSIIDNMKQRVNEKNNGLSMFFLN